MSALQKWSAAVNQAAWEIPAYRAELDFLKNYPRQGMDTLELEELDWAITRVTNNLRYYCGTGSPKPAGCL